MMRNPICLARTMIRSLLCGAWVSGHDFVTSAERTPANVHVLRRRTCGAVSVGWSWGSLERDK